MKLVSFEEPNQSDDNVEFTGNHFYFNQHLLQRSCEAIRSEISDFSLNIVSNSVPLLRTTQFIHVL